MANPFFNAEYYLQQNADVAAAVDGDVEVAEQHYFLYGANEGRKPAPWFDIEFYRASNEKLADVPADQLFLHFTLHGIREGLAPAEGVEFDAAAYAAAEGNEDLIAAFGIEDVDNLTEEQAELLGQHFFAHGYKEGREGGPEIPGEPVDLSELTAAMEAHQEALDAKAEFLKAAAKSDVIKAVGYEDDDLEGYIAGDEGVEPNLIEDVKDGLNFEATASGVAYDFSGVTESAIAPMIGDVKADLAKNLADSITELGKVDKGLKSAIDGALAGAERLKNSKKTQGEAAEKAAAEAAKADVLNDGDELTLNEGDRFVSLTVAAGTVVSVDEEDGSLDINEDLAADVEGFDALLAAIRAWNNADKVVTSHEKSLAALVNQANGKVKEGDDPVFATTGEGEEAQPTLDESGDLTLGENAVAGTYVAATNDVEAFDKAVANYEGAIALKEELVALRDEIDATQEAIELLEYVVIEGEGVLVGTQENDAFVFATNADDVELFDTITLFGEEGNDVFFIGTDYALGADVENGDNGVLEVFLTQNGVDTVVTIEQTAFGSNAAVAETWEVTLVGVNAEDLAFTDGYVHFA